MDAHELDNLRTYLATSLTGLRTGAFGLWNVSLADHGGIGPSIRTAAAEVKAAGQDPLPLLKLLQARNDLKVVIPEAIALVDFLLLDAKPAPIPGMRRDPDPANSDRDFLDDLLKRRKLPELSEKDLARLVALRGTGDAIDLVTWHTDPEDMVHFDRIIAYNRALLGTHSSSVSTTEPPAKSQPPKPAGEWMEKVVQVIGDDVALKVLQIAKDKNIGVSDRLGMIIKLDERFKGKGSAELGELLGVSSGRVRQLDAWKRHCVGKLDD
jgi:hypothetical protein